MTLRTEIFDALIADTSISSYVGDNIYYDILPFNTDVSSYSIVYSSRVANTTHTLNERDLEGEHTLTIKIVGTGADKMELINKEVRRTIQGYSSANVRDILFENDNDVYDEDNNLYTESLDFSVWYLNS